MLSRGDVEHAPAALTLALFMRYIRRWAVAEVVSPKHPGERAVAINQLIQVAHLSVESRSFEVAVAVLEALRYTAGPAQAHARTHGQRR